jgi:hypothetical protein
LFRLRKVKKKKRERERRKRERKNGRKEGSRVLMAHACNPIYSEGRNQETHSSKPARANSSQDPISKIPNTKKGW